jgi:hypothetical protein
LGSSALSRLLRDLEVRPLVVRLWEEVRPLRDLEVRPLEVRLWEEVRTLRDL